MVLALTTLLPVLGGAIAGTMRCQDWTLALALLWLAQCCAGSPVEGIPQFVVGRGSNALAADDATTEPGVAILQHESVATNTSTTAAVAAADTTEGESPSTRPATYSVIVVANNLHTSSLFRDRARVEAYSKGVISIRLSEGGVC